MPTQDQTNVHTEGDQNKQADHGSNALICSTDPHHPANYIATLCKQFYHLGWVTGTGGGVSIRNGSLVYIAPSGVQKELIKPEDMFVMDFDSCTYLRRPEVISYLTTSTTLNVDC